MSVLAPHRAYAIDGVRLSVRTTDPVLEPIVHARLARLDAADDAGRGDSPGMDVVLLEVDDFTGEWDFPRTEGRPVYDPPVGEVRYVDADDRLTVCLGDAVRAVCEASRGRVRIAMRAGAPNARWFASHPVLTLCLLELLRHHGRQPLHAAALALHGRGLVIPGKRGAGKSTLTLALLRAGYALLGDDHCFLTPHAGRARVVGFPDEIDVTDGTIGFFPELAFLACSERLPGAAKRQLRPEQVYATEYATECVPAAIVFPRVAHAPRSTLTVMPADEALLELTPNVLLTAPRRAQAHLDALGVLVRACPAYRLETGRDFDALPAMLAELL